MAGKSNGGKATSTKAADNNGKNATSVKDTNVSEPKKVAKKLDLDKINLDAKVTVRNLASWKVSFNRVTEVGSVSFAPGGTQRISINEISAQVNNGLKLFTGVDGLGSHPTLYIEDKLARYYVGFETEDKEQVVFTDKLVKDLFSLSNEQFKAQLPITIVTRAEKNALMDAIKRLGIDGSYAKIQFAVSYTGFPMPE